MTGNRLPALLALAVLTGLLAVLVLVTTPWQPLRGPIPGGARTRADATLDFTSDEIAREDAFHRQIRPPAYAGMAVGLLVAAILGLTPLGARLVGLVPGPWPVRAAGGAVLVPLAGSVLTLPFDVAAERALRRYGLSTQDWASWAVDRVKGLGVSSVLLVVVAVGLVGLARAAPRTWWAWGAVAAAGLVLAVSFVYPVVVEPVFNRFTPLPAGPLRQELLDLAARDGIPVREVLVADASRRTTALNAYVSGFGSTRRIVLYDTLLERATPAEVRLVVAHELGHVKARDVLHGTALGALGAAAVTVFLWLLLTWEPLLRRAGADSAGDPRALALLLFAVAVLGHLSGPLQTLVSRRIEARADVHSLDLTRDPVTFVESERRLALTNLSDLDPPPLVYALFFTHPSAPERIATARDWARREGVPLP